ncbi:ABC transporter ATP-binding protein [Candidatus Falkowbacteria bacterium]|nr:ABC transporter ATP-binding protein [Candidatus Falkowbacteria bacterium]
MANKTRQTVKIYWQHAMRYKLLFTGMTLFIITASSVGVLIPLYFKKFFDVLTGSGDTTVVATALIYILVVIGALELIQWLFWRLSGLAATYFQAGVLHDLQQSCFEYLHRHSFSFFNDNFVGSLVKRVRYFARAFESIADKVSWHILPLIVNIIIIIAVLLRRNWWLAVGMLVWLLIFMSVNVLFVRFKLRYDIAKAAAETASTGLLADTITNHHTVKLFNGYAREVRSSYRAIKKVTDLRLLTWNLDNIFEAFQGLLTVFLEVGIFYLAVRLWQRGLITVGDFVLVQAYILNIIIRVWDFGKMLRNIYADLADANDMTEILLLPHEIKDVPSAVKLKVGQGVIEFRDVDFYYHQTRKVLRRFNLRIPARQRLAVIGPSGAGKSTLVKLLLRSHEVTGGKILIDGQNIARVTQESLWHNISLVPQDPVLFHRTLKENIRYGRPGATDAAVMRAAKRAHCHQFIMDSPDGYDTYVGERGVKLSGGERQRIAIARAILRNAPILVLDEATSSLDSESEMLIQDALRQLMRDKTVIVIAHRLSTIRKADRIIVVDSGGITEDGTHEQLSRKKNGLYAKLWKLQAGGFIQ